MPKDIKRVNIKNPVLGQKVYHYQIYNGKEKMKIVGIRETEIELERDYSGGIHAVTQKEWFPIEGSFILKKVCEEHQKPNGCQLPNIHCQYPDCESEI